MEGYSKVVVTAAASAEENYLEAGDVAVAAGAEEGGGYCAEVVVATWVSLVAERLVALTVFVGLA